MPAHGNSIPQVSIIIVIQVLFCSRTAKALYKNSHPRLALEIRTIALKRCIHTHTVHAMFVNFRSNTPRLTTSVGATSHRHENTHWDSAVVHISKTSLAADSTCSPIAHSACGGDAFSTSCHFTTWWKSGEMEAKSYTVLLVSTSNYCYTLYLSGWQCWHISMSLYLTYI